MSIEKLLKIVSLTSTDEEDIKKWSEQQSLLDLLEEQRSAQSIMLYGSSFNTGSLLFHSILVPEQDIKDIAEDDFHSGDSSFNSWTCGLVWGGGSPARVEFDNPRFQIGKKTFESSQPLVFSRSFEGRIENKHYFEIAQLLTHAHDLHWTPERHAWCRFDEHGDIENVIQWAEEKGAGDMKLRYAFQSVVMLLKCRCRQLEQYLFKCLTLPAFQRDFMDGEKFKTESSKTGSRGYTTNHTWKEKTVVTFEEFKLSGRNEQLRSLGRIYRRSQTNLNNTSLLLHKTGKIKGLQM